jgi:hypothetical protein
VIELTMLMFSYNISVALADSQYALDFSFPVWVSSCVEYAGHLESGPRSAQQTLEMPSTVHQLTLF